MNLNESKYLELLRNILDNGEVKTDRTQVGTKSVFGTQLRFDLSNHTFPLLTTKKMFTKGIIEELLFFIRGETNTKKLEEKNVNIWKGNTSREFLDKRGLLDYPEGEAGPIYGFQWRNFNNQNIDQLAEVVHTLKTNPNDRRMLVTAWNPAQLNKMALPPCHIMFQFYVSENNKLSCQFIQRSVDSFLGLPFNIASYALLVHLIAKITDMTPNELIFVGGDTHLYLNQLEQVQTQIIREPYEFPKLKINAEITSLSDIEKLTFNDFEIIGYQSHPALKAEMAI